MNGNILTDNLCAANDYVTGSWAAFRQRPSRISIAGRVADVADLLLATGAASPDGCEEIRRSLSDLSRAANRWAEGLIRDGKCTWIIALPDQPDVGPNASSELDSAVYAAYSELWSGLKGFLYAAGTAASAEAPPSAWNQRKATTLARKLLNAATRLLPTADRARYAQIAYSTRLLLKSPRLRVELKAPRRRSATQ